jgi:hypothetical protein
VDRFDNKLTWGSENLLFELLKKSKGEDSICLDMPEGGVTESASLLDGFLSLSDLGEAEGEKFFGISVALKGDGAADEYLEVYDDIDFSTDYDLIKFEEGSISKLSGKIDALSGLRGKKIDVFVTRRWNSHDVGYLCKLLERAGINVRKFLYISSKTNRFLFSCLPDEETYLYNHPYIIWDGIAASLQMNSRIQLYGTMFPVYVELLNPWVEEKLTSADLELILWLAKKRIYRIANFFCLRVPEVVNLFRQAKKLHVHSLCGKKRISVHSII